MNVRTAYSGRFWLKAMSKNSSALFLFWAARDDSVGNASSHIVLNNEHGGIEIRKGVLSMPRPPEPAAPPKAGKALPAPKAEVEPTEN